MRLSVRHAVTQGCISHIFGRCAVVKVGWIYAKLVVARVASAIRRPVTVLEQPSNAVGNLGPSAKAEPAIAAVVQKCLPIPAIIRTAYVNLLPETPFSDGEVARVG